MSVSRSVAELGPRLRTLAEAVLPGEPVADLCCDHALLAIALVGEGRVPRAVAVDLAHQPLAAAAKTRARTGLGDRVELREGDGFRVLVPGEVASVVIAGVGLRRIMPMLADAADSGRLAGLRRLILQAHGGALDQGELRTQLDALEFGLVDERLVHERDRFHLIMVAEPSPAGLRIHDDIDRDLGPLLRRGEDPCFQAWRSREHAWVAHALERMREHPPDDPIRREAFERRRARLDRWLAILAAHSSRPGSPSCP